MNNNTLRIGTRKSRLAMVQTEIVREVILAHFPFLEIYFPIIISCFLLVPDIFLSFCKSARKRTRRPRCVAGGPWSFYIEPGAPQRIRRASI